MVKGISRQVIVVQAGSEEIFDQAIFLLKDKVVTQGVTDEMLLKQAQKLLSSRTKPGRKAGLFRYGWVWSCVGSAVTGIFWLLSLWF